MGCRDTIDITIRQENDNPCPECEGDRLPKKKAIIMKLAVTTKKTAHRLHSAY
jgi:hypothetical protein